jgi:hypothetical protein
MKIGSVGTVGFAQPIRLSKKENIRSLVFIANAFD